MLSDIRVLEISARPRRCRRETSSPRSAPTSWWSSRSPDRPVGGWSRSSTIFRVSSAASPGTRSIATSAASRSICIARDSRELLAELLAKFDIAVRCGHQWHRAARRLSRFPKRPIRIRIAPFGDTGPKSSYASSDLTVMAASGAPGVTGDPDRPPLFFPVPQAMMEAGSDAAIAALAALAARDRDGLGQSGNVSARIAAMMSAMSQHLAPPSGNPETAARLWRDDDCGSADSEHVSMRRWLRDDQRRLRTGVRADDSAAGEVGGGRKSPGAQHRGD